MNKVPHPGAPQTLYRVIQWPGQNAQDGESKIPSLVWYDKRGQVRAAARAYGAEALSASVEEQAETEGWYLAEHWKLHLHPSTMKAELNIQVKPLPPDVSVEKIYADFIGYLYGQTRIYFYDHIIDGERVWKAQKTSIDFVVAHPNGWGLKEQTLIRNAAIAANLVSSEKVAREKIKFVSEAEASVHFVIQNADLKNRLEVAELVVCDAGGSTVDTTLYVIEKVEPILKLKEKRASACVQAGAIFVNETAKKYFSAAFREAELDDPETYVKEAVRSFEEEAKKSFRDASSDQRISVGGRKFTNEELKVRKGTMTLPGSQVQEFFDPCVKKIVESVDIQILGHSPEYLLLVGGFGESGYLYETLKSTLGPRRVEVTVANEPAAKAVADGSVIWFVKRFVSARATRFAFGTDIVVPVPPSDNSDRTVVLLPDGPSFIGAWSGIVDNNVVLEESEEKAHKYALMLSSPSPMLMRSLEKTIYAYDGPESEPAFAMDDLGEPNPGFHVACVVHADLSGAKDGLIPAFGPRGPFWVLPISIALTFGGTEIEAKIIWEERGVTRKSDASVIPPAFT
ncbi:hypothetical protein BOTBODRAFT_161662 [Botryobasidium botryosum FD-172 SS1]|uniref:Actin-like ATPase domain-containing protein n=1 Tax=Botryobasidium botryosum (strain FD-172 SS1) TaxID=930990 RepID=A0A067MLN0_BOTB1|nr:hypothetical protein BOTBODRAFT_161662 [Botryobasidium botryosum FD-172 SS1]